MNAAGKEHLMPEKFSVAVIYEDLETRDRVLPVCRHVEARVGDEIGLKFSWWKFDLLRDSKLAEQATRAAIIADMIVVSPHSGRGLPLVFREWIESWLPRRGYRESVLVALIGSPGNDLKDAASHYLRGLAARARMSYLADPVMLPATASGALADSLFKHAGKTIPILESILKVTRPPTHWGINE